MTRHDPAAGVDLVIATARLPAGDDRIRWHDGASTSASALHATLADHGGAWIGYAHPADRPGGHAEPTIQNRARFIDGVWRHPVPLSVREHDDFDAHCTAALAPLYFDYPQPVYRRTWQDAYRQVNQRYADTAARLAAPAATVWVHDYHLQLVPGYLRQLRPDLSIGFYLHSPFPPPEHFLRQPLRTHILTSLHHADLIGMQHPRSARNLLDTCADLPDQPRHPTIAVYPTSVDVARIAKLATTPDVRARATAIRTQLGNPRLILLSVSALDPAEGVDRRLDAYARLLAEHRLDGTDTVLIHVAPTDDNPRHRHHHEHIDRQTARINGVFARVGHPVVHHLRRHLDWPELVALYTAADILLATPTHHGNAPAAHEFLAARTDNTGHLVLSDCTAAATQLPEAHLVNPYDSDALTDTIAAATTGCHTPNNAIRHMRLRLHNHTAHHWANTFLTALHSPAEHAPPTLAHTRT